MLTKLSVTLTEGIAALLQFTYFPQQNRTNRKMSRNMSINLWEKTFDSIRQIMKQNLLIKNTFVEK